MAQWLRRAHATLPEVLDLIPSTDMGISQPSIASVPEFQFPLLTSEGTRLTWWYIDIQEDKNLYT